MFEWVGKLPYWLRATLSVFSFIGIWLAFSLSPLLDNRPDAFQAAGSIVVAWGILFIGTRRIQYENSIQVAEEVVIASALNRLEAHRKISDERSNLTFDVHMLQIAQLSKHLEVPNPIGPETDKEISELADSVTNRTKGGEFRPAPPEDEQATRALQQLANIKSQFNPWAKLYWRTELAFLVFGTLQWGYGNHWVMALHNQIG